MTLGERLKQLRRELGLSQEAIGKTSLMSAPGWIKLENGQRSPSEKLIRRLYDYLKEEHGYSESKAHKLKLELLLLKYAADPTKFTSVLAMAYVKLYKLESLLSGEKPKAGKNGSKPHARTARPQQPRKRLAIH